MSNWSSEPQPFGANRAPLLTGWASDGSGPVPVAVDKATGRLLTNSTGASGGTSSTFGAAFPATGTAMGAIDATGNMAGLNLDGSGNLKIAGSFSVGGTTDNSAYTAGTSTGTPAMGFYHSTIDAVTDGRSASLAIDSKRNLFTVLRDAAGNARGVNVTAGNALTVDASATTQPVSGTFWQATQPVSGTVTTTPPANASTNIAQFGGSAVTLGQQLAAASMPVILPSATVTSLTPPSNTGYALDASLTTIDTDLKSNVTLHAGSNIIGKVTTDQTTHGTTDLVAADITKVGGSALSIGQQLAAASIPVILPSATITTLTPPAAITNYANETGGNLALLGGAVVAADGTTDPTKVLVVGGESNDVTSQYNPIPLGPAGRTVIVEGFAGGVAVPANLNAETTKVIGVTRSADGSGNLLASSNSALNVVNVDPTTSDKSKVSATQRLRVQPDSTQIFYEAWDSGTIDNVYNWTLPIFSLGATSTPSAGQEVLATGATANSFAYLRSKNTFQPVSPGFLESNHQIAITAPATHAYAFWGTGNPAASPTSALYAVDAIGFEVTAAGVFNAVTWAGNTKNVIAALALPGDTSVHRYQTYVRGDTVYWVQDNVTVASIITGALGPNTNLLPLLMLVGNDSSGSTGFSLTSAAAYMADTTKSTMHISDATHPQLSAGVTAAGALRVDATATVQPVTIATFPIALDDRATVAGAPVATTADGVQLMSIAGPTGDPVDTIGSALKVAATSPIPASNETSTVFSGSIALIPQFATISTSASGVTTLVPGVPGRRIRVLDYTLIANGTVNVKFQSHVTPTDLTGLLYLIANTGAAPGYSPVGKFQTAPGEALDINLSGAIAVGGHLTYVVV